MMKDDLIELFDDLHKHDSFVKSLNTTLLVLIAKKGAKNIKDFRPISLVGYIYKLISKILATRMAGVLRNVIGESQHAFVDRRQIIDAILVANEVVDDIVGNNKDGILCKLDMEIAYNYVN